jgi:hypothetical protein
MSGKFRVAALVCAVLVSAAPARGQYQTSQQTQSTVNSNTMSYVESTNDARRMWAIWGLVGFLGTAAAFGIRMYMKFAKPADPMAAVANDAWVQAKLRGENPPPPIGLDPSPDSGGRIHTFEVESGSPRPLPPGVDVSTPAPVISGQPWKRASQVRTRD